MINHLIVLRKRSICIWGKVVDLKSYISPQLTTEFPEEFYLIPEY